MHACIRHGWMDGWMHRYAIEATDLDHSITTVGDDEVLGVHTSQHLHQRLSVLDYHVLSWERRVCLCTCVYMCARCVSWVGRGMCMSCARACAYLCVVYMHVYVVYERASFFVTERHGVWMSPPKSLPSPSPFTLALSLPTWESFRHTVTMS